MPARNLVYRDGNYYAQGRITDPQERDLVMIQISERETQVRQVQGGSQRVVQIQFPTGDGRETARHH
jgi:hypothetical protein